MYRSLSWFSFFLLLPMSGRAVDIYAHFPEVIHPHERYVIYSHGLIVEGDDPRPVSPKYGQYDFPGIKQALFSGGGFNLIAYQRPKNTEVAVYVGTLSKLAARSHLVSFKEIAISTGKSHGAFFQPLPEWMQPLKAWIAQTNR